MTAGRWPGLATGKGIPGRAIQPHTSLLLPALFVRAAQCRKLTGLFTLYRADLCTSSLRASAVLQIPGVPVMYLQAHRYTVERLPEATLGGAPRT